MQVQRIFFRGHVKQPPRHQPAGEVADAGADFEHRVAQVRAQFARQPAQVLRRAGQVIDDPAAVGRAYRSSISQNRRMTASAFTPSFHPIFLPSS